MESKLKLRGFIKGKPSPAAFFMNQKDSKVNKAISPPYSSASSGFLVKQQKLRVISSSSSSSSSQAGGNYSIDDEDDDKYLYSTTTTDETVDVRASTFISYVQERFKLEQFDSDRRKPQDVH